MTTKVILKYILLGFIGGSVLIAFVNPKFFKRQLIEYLDLQTEIAKYTSSDQYSENHQTQQFNSETSQVKKITNVTEWNISQPVSIAKPAVVGISTTMIERVRPRNSFERFLAPRNRTSMTNGSGFLISKDGFVVTNQHVIENAIEIKISLPDGTRYSATKIGEDKQTDIALLKIEHDGRTFPHIPIGNSDHLKIGEWAIAIGNPFGLTMINDQPTVTLGIISATNRDFGHSSASRAVYENMIQTDAAINSGNSGGPLINASGEVIGMNTFIFTGGSGTEGNVGIAFAIPINKIRKVVNVLQSGDIDRDIETGIIRTYRIDKMRSEEYKLPIGLLITQLLPNGPAANKGIKVGDVILFPNYLMHTAYPFTSNGERRSFSFNAEIDNNIANVFRK